MKMAYHFILLIIWSSNDSQDTDSDSEPLGELYKDGETRSIQNENSQKLPSSRDTSAGKVIMMYIHWSLST